MSGYDEVVTPRRLLAAGALALATAVVAGCGAVGPSASSPSSGPPASAPVLTPVPGGSAAPSPADASPPSQSDTDWGRIWDALPASFPLPPGATPTETGEGPASARVQVPGGAAATAALMQSSLTGRGFAIDAANGPAEDGGFAIDASRLGTECRTQIRVTPLGDVTVVTVLYGALCPFQ